MQSYFVAVSLNSPGLPTSVPLNIPAFATYEVMSGYSKSGAMSLSKTTAYQPEIVIPTFVCSVLSAVASGMVLVLWAFTDDKVNRRTFRYALIINLTFAGTVAATIS